MQVAINILIFILGFSIAGFLRFRPKETRDALDDLLAKLRYVTNAFAPKGADQLDPISEKLEHQQAVPVSQDDMLTMYVAQLSLFNLCMY